MKQQFTISSKNNIALLTSKAMLAALCMTLTTLAQAQTSKNIGSLMGRHSPENTANARVSTTQPTFNCGDGKSYLFQGRDGSGATTLDSDTKVYELNITNGSSTQVSGALLSGNYTSINNVGFNVKDNYLWGYLRGTGKLVRIGSNWSTQIFDVSPANSSIADLAANIPYNAGDVDENGIMYLYYGASDSPDKIRRIDLNPSSSTYLKVLSDISVNFPGTDQPYIIDLAYNAVDKKLYGVSGNVSNNGQNNAECHLYRIALTGGVTDLGNTGISTNHYPFGAVYFDDEGTLFISQNLTGKIYKIKNVSTGNKTASFVRNGPVTNDNDGARCFNSPVPINITGTVFNDANGLTDNTVNGNPVSSLDGNTLYVSLVSVATGKVLATTTLTSGTYSFTSLTPNAAYSVVLSKTAGTVGANPPSTTISSTIVNTGEHIGSGSGSDGTSDGKINVTVTDEDADDVNFGLDRLPTANNVTANAQPNPGGNNTVTVPTLNGSDPEDGTYTGTSKTNTIIIKSLPTNGTLYYNGQQVTDEQVIANYDPSKLMLDPAPTSGVFSVTFTYAERDAAGKDSAPATVTIPFTAASVTISGTVFNDANGITDGIVNGTAVSSLAGNTFSVNLVGSNGKVVATTTLNNGTYSFANVTPGSSYTVLLSNTAGVVGSNPPSTSLSGSVVNTGENIGSGSGSDGTPDGKINVTVTNSSVSNVNFGVDRLPTANNVTATTQANPGGANTVTVPTLNGSDPEDGTYTGTSKTNTIIIKSLPTNGTLYYNGQQVTDEQVIANYDPSKLMLDPAPTSGVFSVTFTYAERDAAGKDSAPATVTIPFGDLPDLTPIIYALPTVVYGTTNITIVVNVVELNKVATNGLITVYVSKDAKTNLSFNSSATVIGGRSVQNSVWTFDGTSNTSYYILKTNQVVSAGDVLTFGLTGTLTPGATMGSLTFSTVIMGGSGGEVRYTNNSDADKTDYFIKK